MAHIYTMEREQIIACDLQLAWDFISTPKNLDLITPPNMCFEIITDVPEKMYDGLLIQYRVGIPLLGKQNWLSELKHIREGHSFVDEQLIGPYKLWYHYHEVTQVEGGVKFTDRVHYAPPFGPLGTLAHAIYIKRELERVFSYRKEAMVQHLGNSASGN